MKTVKTAQHLGWEPGLEDGTLQILAIAEERCQKRLKRGDPYAVEGARTDPGEIGVTGLHILDGALLVIGFTVSPKVGEPIRRVPFDCAETSVTQVAS